MQRWLCLQGQTAFISIVLFGFLAPNLEPGRITFTYPESGANCVLLVVVSDLGCFFPQALGLGIKYLLLAWVLNPGVFFFTGLGLGAEPLGSV